MSSQYRIGWHRAQRPRPAPGSPHGPSTLVRNARMAGLGKPGTIAIEPTLELRHLLAVKLSTLDGALLCASQIIVHRSLLILVDANRATPERLAAEIGWVEERLDEEIDLVLIWPGAAVDQARMIRPGPGTRMFLDANAEFRRLVSPTGKRRAVLVVPETGTIDRISGKSPVFAVGHHNGGSDERRADRTIDLGDVYH